MISVGEVNGKTKDPEAPSVYFNSPRVIYRDTAQVQNVHLYVKEVLIIQHGV